LENIYKDYKGNEYVKTGVVRLPKKGEYYIDGCSALKAYSDHDDRPGNRPQEILRDINEKFSYISPNNDVFVKTGEYRSPKMGDFYLNEFGSVITCYGDHSEDSLRYIMRKVEVDQTIYKAMNYSGKEFVKTGEYRPASVGEWYVGKHYTNNAINAYVATQGQVHILREVTKPVEEVKINKTPIKIKPKQSNMLIVTGLTVAEAAHLAIASLDNVIKKTTTTYGVMLEVGSGHDTILLNISGSFVADNTINIFCEGSYPARIELCNRTILKLERVIEKVARVN
jgi:hypothetical protein